MARKRITERFPWLLPLRRWQRKRRFYRQLERDGNRYASEQRPEDLPCELFRSSCPMINENTGFDLRYQENKAHNLKLAAATIDGLVIRPGESFSFWRCVRYADRDTPYLDGLAEVNGRLVTQRGGGLCMLSNLLFWLFLHSPMTVTERWGHDVKEFPEPESDAPRGVDATVAEGWKDLKVRNDTDLTVQLRVSFSETHITGRILASRDTGLRYEAVNKDLAYIREADGVYEDVTVCQLILGREDGRCVAARPLYHNRCRIAYALPEGTVILDRREKI